VLLRTVLYVTVTVTKNISNVPLTDRPTAQYKVVHAFLDRA